MVMVKGEQNHRKTIDPNGSCSQKMTIVHLYSRHSERWSKWVETRVAFLRIYVLNLSTNFRSDSLKIIYNKILLCCVSRLNHLRQDNATKDSSPYYKSIPYNHGTLSYART